MTPSARDLAADAIAAASRDPIAAHRRAQRDLDIPEPPGRLTDRTRTKLIRAHVGDTTFAKPVGLIRRLVRAWRNAA